MYRDLPFDSAEEVGTHDSLGLANAPERLDIGIIGRAVN
jgi:hypothetical protein